MRRKIYLLALIVVLSATNFHTNAASYYIPTEYRGIFYGQPTSARATALGLTTITLGGIENVVYNPASIGLERQAFNFYLNYATGDQIEIGSKYSFLGASYRLNSKLVLGISRQHWAIKDSPWTVIIGSFEENVEKSTESMYTLSAAYEVVPNLQVGLSGNYLVQKRVPGEVTNSEFIVSIGAIYDRNVDWIKAENLENQKIRFAASFINLFMKNAIETRYQDYLHNRDLPILLTLGTSYHGTLPFKSGLLNKVGFLSEAPEEVDLSLHLQYQNALKGPEVSNSNNYDYNTSIGIGAEALFMKSVALRLGYFYQKRPEGQKEDGGFWATTHKKGLTFGYGVKIPVNRLSDDKIPFDVDVDMVTFKVLNELNTKNYTHNPVFNGNKFLFALAIKLRWVK